MISALLWRVGTEFAPREDERYGDFWPPNTSLSLLVCRHNAFVITYPPSLLRVCSDGWLFPAQHRAYRFDAICDPNRATCGGSRIYEFVTIERLQHPVKLQSPFPGTPDRSLPEEYRHVLDPLDALTFVAAQTTKSGWAS